MKQIFLNHKLRGMSFKVRNQLKYLGNVKRMSRLFVYSHDISN